MHLAQEACSSSRRRSAKEKLRKEWRWCRGRYTG